MARPKCGICICQDIRFYLTSKYPTLHLNCKLMMHRKYTWHYAEARGDVLLPRLTSVVLKSIKLCEQKVKSSLEWVLYIVVKSGICFGVAYGSFWKLWNDVIKVHLFSELIYQRTAWWIKLSATTVSLKIFFLYIPRKKVWHFMQIVYS